MVQKSSEDYLAENEELLKELEQPDPEPEAPPSEPASIEEDPPEVEVIPEPEIEPEPKEEPEAEPSQDYKKKFSESSKEAQKIVAKNRKLNQAIDEANDITEPTEEELRAEYRDWDILDEVTQRLAKESLMSTKRFALISQARTESKKIEKWDEDVDKFVDNPQSLIDNPDLEGKIDEFKAFANQEPNTNIPFKLLVSSFLYDQAKSAKPKSKGSMFPDGSGGPNDKPKPKSDKISIEDSEILRQTNYNEYKRLLVAGKIETNLN